MGDAEPTKERFVWPPRRVPEAELNAPARPLDAGGRYRIVSRSRAAVDDDAGLGDAGLDWSEPEHAIGEDGVEAGEDGGVGTERVAAASPTRGMARWVEAFEIAYLGRVSASWDVRARDAGWRADEEGGYCPRCGMTVGVYALDTLTDPPTCPACRGRKVAWDRFVRLGAYEGVLAGAIRELKFHAMRAHGERLGALLGERIAALLGAMGVRGDEAAVVPVPMTAWRRMARGVDHAATIARSAARAAGVPLVRALWRRHRPAQWSVAPSERRRNVAGSFGVRGGGVWDGWMRGGGVERLRGRRVVMVVDDVRTTGATMTEACRVLDRAIGGGGGGSGAVKGADSPIIIAATVAVARIRGERGGLGPGR